jgi:hypothetical protein
MNKVKKYLQSCHPLLLGLTNGILFALFLEVFFRILYLWFLYEEYLRRLKPSDVNIDAIFIVSFDFRYYLGLLLTIISAILSTWLISKSLPRLSKFTILFWQITGFFTICWLILLGKVHSFVLELIECGKLSCHDTTLLPSFDEFDTHHLSQILFFLVLILTFNLLFSLLLRERKRLIP